MDETDVNETNDDDGIVITVGCTRCGNAFLLELGIEAEDEWCEACRESADA